ncbi:MAG TPA: CxxC-x17-CxxC domain-containing protein [Candidatus Paceibacterota bacterium]
MGNFDRGGNKGGGFNKGGFGGKPSFQKKSWGNNDNDRAPMMYKATCAECSKTCEVPFRPTSGKPVFCNDCFNGQRDSNDSRGGRPSFNDRGPKRDFGGDRPSFRPQEDRPSFKAAPADNKRELAEISTKLDRLISVMEKMAGSTAAPKEKAVEKAVEAPKVEKKAEAKKAEAKKAPAKAAKPAAKKAEVKKAPAKKVVAKKKK